MLKTAMSFLETKGYKVNNHAAQMIDICYQWYGGEDIQGFHNRVTVNNVDYEMSHTGFAKRACEDDANLCEIVEIKAKDETTTEYIADVLNKNSFQKKIREQLELISACGTCAAYVRMKNADVYEDGSLNGGEMEIVFVRPDGVVPLKVERGIVTECAFVADSVENSKRRYSVVIFRQGEGGKYESQSYVLDENGIEIPSRTTVVTLGEVCPFAILTTAAVNNYKDMDGFGLPKVYNAIPCFKVLDLCFNVLYGDLDKADKMILYNEALAQFDQNGNPITPNKQHKKTFVSMGAKLPEAKDLVQEINPEIRIDQITKSFELVLSMISTMFGYGTKKYTFENGQIKTATEYIGTKQDSMQELNRQRQNLTEYIENLIRVIFWFSNAFNGTNYDIDTEIVIDYDDSYITDRESELEAMRQDAQIFQLPRLMINYLMERYSLTEEQARAWYEDKQTDPDESGEV